MKGHSRRLNQSTGCQADGCRVSAHLPASLLTWGSVTERGESALIAGEVCDLEVAIEVSQAISPGLSIEVWTHFVSDIDRVYVGNPDEPARFECESNGRPVVARAYPDGKVHGPGAFFPYRRYAAIELPEGAAPGDRFTFRFQNVSMQTYEENPFNLRFAIMASERDEVIGYLGDAFYTVVGGPPAHLRLVAPTCAAAGEVFDCRIVVCDRYGNKTGNPLADLQFEVEAESSPDSVALGPITYTPKWRRHTLHDIQCETEGVIYLRARLADADPAIVGVSNPIVVRTAWKEHVLWGDLHQHAYYCDGRGTPAGNYAYAISTSCLDFCAVTPHEESTFAPGLLRIPSPPQTGWEEMVEAAERCSGDELVTILGAEPGGLTQFISHVNAYYLDHDNRPVTERLMGRWWETREARPRVESYQQFLDELGHTKGDVLLLPHAHARGGPGVYDLPVLPELQTNVEICSVHGVFEGFYAQWLKHGHYVGVHAGGDNHMTSTGNGNPGYHYPNTNGLAAVWTSERSRRGVWDAVKHRRTYAVTGNQRIFLDLQVEDQPVGTVIVDRGCRARVRSVQVEVAGTAPIMRIDLARNGEIVHSYRPSPQAREVLRLMWADDWCSRRVDDSLTTGTIALDGGRLDVMAALNAYHRTDAFVEQDGEIVFRSNGYSGITRGLLATVTGRHDRLRFWIEDVHLGAVALRDTLQVSLAPDHVHVTRPLAATQGARRPLFTREPHEPHFTLEADWVDPDWPKHVRLAWADHDNSPAYYTVRVEQIDGNVAWSSPIWFRDRLPEPSVPGRVVRIEEG